MPNSIIIFLLFYTDEAYKNSKRLAGIAACHFLSQNIYTQAGFLYCGYFYYVKCIRRLVSYLFLWRKPLILSELYICPKNEVVLITSFQGEERGETLIATKI